MPLSQSAVSFFSVDVASGKAGFFRGQPSSSSWVGMSDEMDVEIPFPDQISGPPMGWRSARRRVAMLRAMTDVHTGVRRLSVWKASCMGQYQNLVDALCNEARAVTPRAS